MLNNFMVASIISYEGSRRDISNFNRESNRSELVLRLPPLTAMASRLPKLSLGLELEIVVSPEEGKISSIVGIGRGLGFAVGADETGCEVGRVDGDAVGLDVGENVLGLYPELIVWIP